MNLHLVKAVVQTSVLPSTSIEIINCKSLKCQCHAAFHKAHRVMLEHGLLSFNVCLFETRVHFSKLCLCRMLADSGRFLPSPVVCAGNRSKAVVHVWFLSHVRTFHDVVYFIVS